MFDTLAAAVHTPVLPELLPEPLPELLPDALPLELLDELPLPELPEAPPDDELPPLLLPEPSSPWVACESSALASESGAALDSESHVVESHVVLLSKASFAESARELSNEDPTSPGPTSA